MYLSTRKNSISTPPPLPLSTVEGADDAETDTPREDCASVPTDTYLGGELERPRIPRVTLTGPNTPN